MQTDSFPALATATTICSTSDDRRGDPRLLANAAVTCRLSSTDPAASVQSWTGRVRDISSLGIGLLLSGHVRPGALLDIDLANKNGNWVGAVRGRVIHVMRSGANWLVGCAFVSELDNAELRLFNAEKARPEIADGRRWVRFPCNVETVCYTAETAPGERRRARIENISAGGIGLLLSCEFSAGTVLRLELPAEMSQPARLLLIRVIHCVESPGRGWVLGCEFADQLASDDLERLS